MTNRNRPRKDPEYVEGLVDALDHIARVCRGSRTQTRRIRWIEMRARCAVEGGEDWRDAEIPKHDPTIEALRGMIAEIYPLVVEALEETDPNPEWITEEEVERRREIFERFVAGVRENCHWIAREHDAARQAAAEGRVATA